MKRALTATADLASVMGGDLNGAATKVAQAAAGNVKGLRQLVGGFDETRLKAEGFSYVLERIEEKFGGQGQALAATYEGRIAQLGNTWNNVQESVGRAITTNATVLEVISQLNQTIDANTEGLNQNAAVMDLLSGAIIGTVRGLALLMEGADYVQRGWYLVRQGADGLVYALALAGKQFFQFLADVAGGVQSFGGKFADAIGISKDAVASLQASADTAGAVAYQFGRGMDESRKTSEGLSRVLQGTAGTLTNVANNLEATRGKAINLDDKLKAGVGNWNSHTTATNAGAEAAKKAAAEFKKLVAEVHRIEGIEKAEVKSEASETRSRIYPARCRLRPCRTCAGSRSRRPRT